MTTEPTAARRCHCGREVVPRDPDPWEGRMDDFCEDCALNRCDCYPDVCPVKYSADRAAARECNVYIVASKEIGVDWPKGDCFICKLPLRDHQKRVSRLVPPGAGYVIDEEMIRV